MYKKLLLIICMSSLLNSSLFSQNGVKLLSIDTEYTAGSLSELKFSTSKKVFPTLYLTNSYGTTIINATYIAKELIYNIPTQFSSKIGILNWKLLTTKNTISGQINIVPKEAP